MDDLRNNLLLRLYQWAVRQDENFTTEAFAHLLQYLLTSEPKAAVRVLHALTDTCLTITPAEASQVQVVTQVVNEEGRPDIEIRAPGHLIYVEVKVEAGLGHQQLRNYRRALAARASYNTRTSLVLLTRYAESFSDGYCPDVDVRWYQLADWISVELDQGSIEQPVSQFMAHQDTVGEPPVGSLPSNARTPLRGSYRSG